MVRFTAIVTIFILVFGCSNGGAFEKLLIDQSIAAETSLRAKVTTTDWPMWRGPNRNGIAADGQQPPVSWSATKNILWKTTVPGRGHASPTVVGNRVVLATAFERRQVQSVICFNRRTGVQLWKSDISKGGFPRGIHSKNTHATCTVASDRDRLFAVFCHHGHIQASALSLNGKILWQQVVGPFAPQRHSHGYAPSPTIYKSLVIIAAEYGRGGYLAGLDCRTGKVVWKQSRPAMLSHSSPIVANRHQPCRPASSPSRKGGERGDLTHHDQI